MEESKHQQQQQQILLQMQQHQQQLQHRQQQMLLLQHLQKQQQQTSATMSMFPSSGVDSHNLRPLIQTRPVNPSAQNPNFAPNSIPQQRMMMIQQQQQQQQEKKSMMIQQQQQLQQQEKSNRPLNQIELQFAYQDAWRVCHPDFKRPFASLEDACERLLPYHVVADYEAEEDDIILNSDAMSLSRSQQWDNNIVSKVAEYAATFEKQAKVFNVMTRKRKDGELRCEERLMVEQVLLLDERNACIAVKTEIDREMKMKMEQEARMRMAVKAEAQQQQQQRSHMEMMMMGRNVNPLRGNANSYQGEQGRSLNPDEMMMMMNGWGNHHNNMTNSLREEKEPLEDFLNDEENGKFGANGEFDLNTL